MTQRFRLGAYLEFKAPAELRPFVSAIWSYVRPVDSDPISGNGHRLLPDTDLSLAWVTRRDARGDVIDARAIVRGPITATAFFKPPPGYRIDAVRLRPEWCRDLLGIDPSEHLDSLPELREVRRALVASFDVRVAENGDAITALIDLVLKRSAAVAPSRNAVIASSALTRIRRSQMTFRAIARDHAMSERQLRRVVRAASGFGAKYVQRIARLQRAVVTADAVERPDWAAIALDAGFYDQSHLIAQCSALTGCTPSELFRERRLQ